MSESQHEGYAGEPQAPPVVLTPEQQQIEQLNAQISVLDGRVKELAGYQAEAIASRDAISQLTAQLNVVTAAHGQAVNDAAQARAAAVDASLSTAADPAKVDAAHRLAAAIRDLL